MRKKCPQTIFMTITVSDPSVAVDEEHTFASKVLHARSDPSIAADDVEEVIDLLLVYINSY